MEFTKYIGLDCVRLRNAAVDLLVTQSVGPRLISLSLQGGQNLMADIPHLTLDCPDEGELNLWGGHRLWHAPEVKRRTYLPDNQPVTITEINSGIEVVQPIETQTGIEKSMRITLPDQSASITIDHILKNTGLWAVDLAPWAITQLRPGGVAILPQNTTEADPDGVLPNRRLTLWPYTDINSPHLQWGNQFVFVRADMQDGALKLGFPNPAGWLAYLLGRTLFVKQAAYQPEADYLDFGSSSECYCCPDFIELETLGPGVRLEPGQSASHRETWRLYADVELDLTPENVGQLAADLGL